MAVEGEQPPTVSVGSESPLDADRGQRLVEARDRRLEGVRRRRRRSRRCRSLEEAAPVVAGAQGGEQSAIGGANGTDTARR